MELRDAVRSQDDTSIGYRRAGSGPGLVILHGGMEHSGDYTELMDRLAGRFTVYNVDRRGRGMSGPHGADYSLHTEVSDLAAVLYATGAHYLFGVSSGATIALVAAATLSGVRAVAAYEPALTVPGHGSDRFIDRYEREIAQERPAAALVTILKGVRVGPRLLRWAPRPAAEFLVRKLLMDDQQSEHEEVSFAELIPTQHYDFLLEREASQDLNRLNTLSCPVLLLGGTTSPRYLSAALRFLENGSRRERATLRGLGHTGASNRRQGGRPAAVADHIIDFIDRRCATDGA